ncbi:MAG: hypothetical protein IIB73_13095, partial [Proteobacteria bacterium]|nr:hypothetical protein [Pseudomonadota bacterium]
GRWIRIIDDVITLLMFGAKGDGVTDDSTAIQAVMDSSESSIYAPAGTYSMGWQFSKNTSGKPQAAVGRQKVASVLRLCNYSPRLVFAGRQPVRMCCETASWHHLHKAMMLPASILLLACQTLICDCLPVTIPCQT